MPACEVATACILRSEEKKNGDNFQSGIELCQCVDSRKCSWLLDCGVCSDFCVGQQPNFKWQENLGGSGCSRVDMKHVQFHNPFWWHQKTKQCIGNCSMRPLLALVMCFAASFVLAASRPETMCGFYRTWGCQQKCWHRPA
jgi:hypothetical protein